MTETYKQRYTPQQRAKRLQKVLSRNAVPVVLEKCSTFVGPTLDVTTFCSAGTKSVAALITSVTASNPCAADFVYYVDDGRTPLDTNLTIQDVYDAYKDEDQFLYLWYGAATVAEEATAIDPTRPYRDQVPFEVRCQLAAKWHEADAVPLVCEPEDWSHSEDLPCLYERVYSERRDLTVGEFISNISVRMSIDPTESLFLYVADQRTVSVKATLGSLYDKHKDSDGFLYLCYSRERTFG